MAGEIYKSPEGPGTMFQQPPSVEELQQAFGREPIDAMQAKTAGQLDQIADATHQLQTGGIRASPEALGGQQVIRDPLRPGNLPNQTAGEIVSAISRLASTDPQRNLLIQQVNLNQYNPGALRAIWQQAQSAIRRSNPGIPYRFE